MRDIPTPSFWQINIHDVRKHLNSYTNICPFETNALRKNPKKVTEWYGFGTMGHMGSRRSDCNRWKQSQNPTSWMLG